MTGIGARIMGALVATYNFFVGDAVILGVVAAAFVITALLVFVAHSSQLLAGIVFVALILLSVTLTLGRERAATQRKQHGG
ncbi:MAG TPA: hypothetical protein VGN32_14230 [Ktedonobacterales bacterium]|jgi:Flp pilus assembly protein TadB|nr:hypothetical protein [Ktedonobacterales bacterium]